MVMAAYVHRVSFKKEPEPNSAYIDNHKFTYKIAQSTCESLFIVIMK